MTNHAYSTIAIDTLIVMKRKVWKADFYQTKTIMLASYLEEI